MNIKELLEAARNTPVRAEQVDKLRTRLKKQASENDKSSVSKDFLARTYSL